MRTATFAVFALLALGAGSMSEAQILRRPPPGLPPPPPTIESLQADLVAKTGSDTVYFVGGGHGITAAGQATLVAQARWLRSNPAVRARIEGHADDRTPGDQALAIGERRANAVRDFLVLHGVPAAQLAITSWGKERPVVEGASEEALALNRRATTMLMR